MKNTLETRLGIFFALVLVALILIVEIAGGLSFFKPGLTVRANFERIQELKEGDPVKMAGVTIGSVKEITLSTNQVEVRIKLEDPKHVKTDSVATIKFTGLMGQNFVSIGYGSPSAPQVTENTLLQTTEPTDLTAIFEKLDSVAGGVEKLTSSFSGDGMANMLGPLNDFFRENSPKLAAILDNLQTTSSNIVAGKGTVGRLINEDGLYREALATVTNLNAAASEIEVTLAQAREVVENLQAGQGTLGKLTTDDTLYIETTTAMTNLREIMEKINRGEGSAGKLVNDDTLYNNAKLTLQKVDKATEGIEDQGPLSVMGVLVNGLF